MFLLPEIILFSPLIAYSCIRIRKLFLGPHPKNISTFFFILLIAGYPVAEFFAHREISGWTRYLVIIGYYCLPYLLYLTLLVVTVDAVIFLGRILRLVRTETVSSSRFRILRLATCLILPALIVFTGAWNNNRLKVKEFSVELSQRSSQIEQLRIVFASDFHLGPITNNRLLNRFVEKVNALNPDIILIGGDILEGHGNESPSRFEIGFSMLRAKYGVYAAPGNHEGHDGSPRGFYVNSGIKLLEDQVENIDNAFYLAGRKDGRRTKRISIESLLSTASDDLPIILLDHSPTDLERISRSRVNLQLSGHTHNGQLFPINLLVMPFLYELPAGAKTKGHTQFIVSSGVQAWGPPVKTAGVSEILLVKVTFKSNSNRPKPISRPTPAATPF